MDKQISVFSFGRTQSYRCPNKMLREFGGTTLTDIILGKLKILGDHAFFAGYEDAFKHKCSEHGVRFVARDYDSVSIDGPITDILSFLKYEAAEYFLIINGCLPFLTIETIQRFLDEVRFRSYQPAFAISVKNNFFLDNSYQPINFSLDMKTINTKTVDSVFEFAHALYFFEKDYFFKEGRYWDWNQVEFISIDNQLELLDIDTEQDFNIAEILWKSRSEI